MKEKVHTSERVSIGCDASTTLFSPLSIFSNFTDFFLHFQTFLTNLVKKIGFVSDVDEKMFWKLIKGSSWSGSCIIDG